MFLGCLPVMPAFDIVGVGLNATDTMIVIPAAPEWGGKVPFSREFYSVGGQVATAMVTCARLGMRTKYIGAVGDDLRGKIQMKSLRESGIDIEHVRQREKCANQSAYIVIDQSTGERTVFWHHARCLELSPEEIAPDQIRSARMLHLDGHDIHAAQHAAAIANAAGIPVSMDLDTAYPNIETVLPLVDYLVTSTEFPTAFTGIGDLFGALSSLQRRFTIRVVAATLGKWGVLAYTDGGFHYSPGYVVNCLDTTGAGDVFHGAFCYSVIERMPIREALRFSNAMAAFNCTAFGARGAIASLAEARQVMDRSARCVHPDVARRTTTQRP